MIHVLTWISHLLAALNPNSIDRIARFIAFFSFDLLRVRRNIILNNIALAMGSSSSYEDHLRLAKASMYHLALTLLEFLRSVKNTPEHALASHVTFKEKSYIDNALKEGKGCFLLVIHAGNWEAFGAAMSRYIAPTHVPVKKVGSDKIDDFVNTIRRKNGFIPLLRQHKGDAIRSIKNALKRGEIIGFIMDQTRPGEPRIPLFGVPAKTNTGLAALWRRYKAPIVPAIIRRVALGVHEVEFFPPLILEESENPQEDILTHTTYFNTIVEKLIHQNPTQYFWIHHRWK